MPSLPTSLNFASVGFALSPRIPYPRLLPKSFERFELHRQMEQFPHVVRIDMAVSHTFPLSFFKIIEAEQDLGGEEDIT